MAKTFKPTQAAPAARTRPIPEAVAAVIQELPTPAPAGASTATPVAGPTAAPPLAAPAQAARPNPPGKPEKPEKPKKLKKPKLMRERYTIPKAEYKVLEDLKQRAASAGRPVKKSELLRAGIKALAARPDAELLAALEAVPSIQKGRPAKA